MPDPVELRLVTSSSSPRGTGSFNYSGEYSMVVQNIAFEKQRGVGLTCPMHSGRIGARWKR